MREGIALVAVGTVLGFAGAVLVSRALASMTAELARAFGASTGDPLLLVGAPLLLGAPGVGMDRIEAWQREQGPAILSRCLSLRNDGWPS